jgi:hypothetical protein
VSFDCRAAEISVDYGITTLANILSGANAFEISDIQENETGVANQANRNVTMLHCAENR